MELSKKVGYIKGLMAGLNIDDSTNEGKVLLAMSDLLEEIADNVENMEESMDAFYETASDVEDIKEMLGDIMEGTIELDDEDFDDEDDDDFDYDDDEEFELIDEIEEAFDGNSSNEVDFGEISLRPILKGKKPPKS